MKTPRQSLRRFLVSVTILCCLIGLVAAPVFISGRHPDLSLKNAAVFAASTDSYSLSSPVRLLQTPLIELESGTIFIPQNSTGLARSGEMLARFITGSSSRIALKDAKLSADFSGSEITTLNKATPGGVAPLVAMFQDLKFDSLTVSDSTVHVKLADGSTLALHNVTADVTSNPEGIVHAEGSFVLRGEKVAFDTTFGTNLDAKSGARLVSASLKSRLLVADFDGYYMLGENPRLLSQQGDLKIPSLQEAANWIGVAWPSSPGFKDFHAKGQLEWVNRTITFQDAVVQMDGNEATGTLSVNFSGERPAIEGTLGFNTLDLTSYFRSSDDAQTSSESLLSLVSTATDLNFPLVGAIDADLRISSDSVVVPGVTIGNSAATISLKGGKMIADVAELEIDDGTRGGGQLRIDMNGPQPSYDIRGKLEDLDIGRAAQAIFGHATIQGRGGAIIEISATGDTGTSLLNSLSGKFYVTMADGGSIGLDIDQLSVAVTSPEARSIWTTASTGVMSVDHLDARFAVVNGVIRTERVWATSGKRAVEAEGAINLSARMLDLSLVIGDRPAAEDARPEPRVVIDMRGPWKEPSLRPGLFPTNGMLSTQ
ncbi:MAG: AsmA family protein [Hyphomicrobium sp.]|nr:AsmA family protein [Hyphomicrobium sp.]